MMLPTNLPSIWDVEKSCKNLKKKKEKKRKSLSKGAKWCKDAKRGEGMKWLKHSLNLK